MQNSEIKISNVDDKEFSVAINNAIQVNPYSPFLTKYTQIEYNNMKNLFILNNGVGGVAIT